MTHRSGTLHQIFAASTGYGSATLAAALDAGMFGPGDREHRMLLVTNNAPNPEITPALDRMPGFDRIRARFDAVVHWNEVIHPHHPAAWNPRPQDTTAWQRLLRQSWHLGDEPVELVLESIQAAPALALAAVFADSPLHIYADGLMSYGPTRDRLPHAVHGRIRRLLHPDVVTGLRPLLLSEYAVAAETVPAGAMQRVFAELEDCAPPLAGEELTAQEPAGQDREGPVLVLGQYLAAAGVLSADEERELHVRMLHAAARAGHRTAVFKPHPSALPLDEEPLLLAAEAAGMRLVVCDTPVLAETLVQRLRPALVTGCFSTALLTAAVHYGVPVAAVGTDLLLERLSPYENGNRIPVTLVRALLPDLERDGYDGKPLDLSPAVVNGRIAPLLTAVGHCMQPEGCAHLREEAEHFLAAHCEGPGRPLGPETARYFKRRRLRALGLPGAPGPATPAARLRTAVHRIRRTR
ncbi:alpha-2,8-polysialyltransferase family protein [Streptomyces sp. A3M-1-3]|uniref:alpha-2,8-polysialyltransferase family protein n=1 Tax=Streptomyces sp. A3M-1-3 TaxID=2962044 RepID=UPI0020B87148|nr:alpha-2,8-polysialyltransferase family protein [Streptomyces sp. A3M-1-3]MCP3818065.1 alpha-2,8-polysialyltransferase family protein [Streptomyces sp. A3M-1-3]